MATIALTSDQMDEVVKRVLSDDIIELCLLLEKDAVILEEIWVLWAALEHYMNQKDRIRLLETWPQLADIIL
tara:strand:- start:212 stop:427 length:216 start_codon:yes stop_codon:yes gene_type:complete